MRELACELHCRKRELCAPCSKTDECFDEMFVCVCTCARCPPQRFLMLCTVSCEELEQLVLATKKYLVITLMLTMLSICYGNTDTGEILSP